MLDASEETPGTTGCRRNTQGRTPDPNAPVCKSEERTDDLWKALTLAAPSPDKAKELAAHHENGDRYYIVECTYPDGRRTSEERWVPQQGPGALTPAQEAMINSAVKEMALPTPRVEAWPTLDRQIVGVETWLHVSSDDPARLLPFAGAAPVTDRLTVGATSVQASATITGPVRWDFGTDTSGRPLVKECPDAGKPWAKGVHEKDPARCAMRFYEKQPSGTLIVTLTYDVTWTATTGQTGTVTGITRTASLPFRVREIQAVGRG